VLIIIFVCQAYYLAAVSATQVVTLKDTVAQITSLLITLGKPDSATERSFG